MLTLPIPMIVAMVLGFLVVRSWLQGDRPWLFSALLASCALQGVVISLGQHYGVAALRPRSFTGASSSPSTSSS